MTTDDSRRVVIAGSMSAFRSMSDLASKLRSLGIDAVIPEAEDCSDIYSPDGWRAFKRQASLTHISTIRDDRTAALLVANVDKGGRVDYVGANTFAEIAIAFADHRPVYLLHGMPTEYADELDAWGVTCLHGDLQPLRDHLADQRTQLV